jgi:beta-lactamase superfamily II metal-dependent hydrolase
MFPAAYGDALWIEYGDPNKPRRLLVDGGNLAAVGPLAARIRAVAATDPSGTCRFELAVLTHIDGDHIEGFLSLIHNMTDGMLPMQLGEIWFNGAPHLPDPDQDDEPPAPGANSPDHFGALQGEMLSFVLFDRKLPWNLWSSMGPIFIPKEGPLPAHELPGGMRLTLLGPTFERLQKLRRKWDKEIAAWSKQAGKTLDAQAVMELLAQRPEGRILSFRDAGIDVPALVGELGEEDTSEPNGSSIALLAEFEGKRCLLAGDAFARDTAAAVRRLLEERAPKGGSPDKTLALDALKVAHHGSRNNISEDLLSVLDCDRFLVSTSGAVFGHPDAEAIACIVAGGGRRDANTRAARPAYVHFNYRCPQTLLWNGKDISGKSLATKFNFKPNYPPRGKEGIRVVLGE